MNGLVQGTFSIIAGEKVVSVVIRTNPKMENPRKNVDIKSRTPFKL